jgi:hypothetical protein
VVHLLVHLLAGISRPIKVASLPMPFKYLDFSARVELRITKQSDATGRFRSGRFWQEIERSGRSRCAGWLPHGPEAPSSILRHLSPPCAPS